MLQRNRLLPILIFQIIPLLLFPPSMFKGALPLIGFVALVFVGLGIALWRGRAWALTLSIFLQGFNIIIRIMMLFPHAFDKSGVMDGTYVIFAVLSISLSLWFLLRLDRPDIRSIIVA